MAQITQNLKFTAIFLSLMVGHFASADTPLKLSTDVIRIEGQARSSTEVSVMAYYIPLYNFDKTLSKKDCEFTEDRWLPNGDNKNVNLKNVRQADGSYYLEIPTTAQRDNCPYVLESTYLNVEDGKKITESINLFTERTLKQRKEQNGDDGGLIPVYDFNLLTAIYCEYETEFDYGYCSAAQGSIELSYSITDQGTIYHLDVFDVKDKPERQY
jgi:hypothetical protein